MKRLDSRPARRLDGRCRGLQARNFGPKARATSHLEQGSLHWARSGLVTVTSGGVLLGIYKIRSDPKLGLKRNPGGVLRLTSTTRRLAERGPDCRGIIQLALDIRQPFSQACVSVVPSSLSPSSSSSSKPPKPSQSRRRLPSQSVFQSNQLVAVHLSVIMASIARSSLLRQVATKPALQNSIIARAAFHTTAKRDLLPPLPRAFSYPRFGSGLYLLTFCCRACCWHRYERFFLSRDGAGIDEYTALYMSL